MPVPPTTPFSSQPPVANSTVSSTLSPEAASVISVVPIITFEHASPITPVTDASSISKLILGAMTVLSPL